MATAENEIARLHAIVLQDLESPDEGARAAFRNEFGAQLPSFVSDTAAALTEWSNFVERLDDNNVCGINVAAIVFTTITHHVTSYKLFMSGYTVASGSLFRQVLEGASLALLCSIQSLPVLERFMEDKYSPQNAVQDLTKHRKKARINDGAMQVMQRAYKFYHKYAHLTKLTIAASANFSQGGAPNVGAYFDPAKVMEYRKEVKGPDPNRTNPAIRNSTQRLLPVGASDGIVSRILLTAERLCKATYLGPSFPEKKAINLAWQQTKDVIVLQKMAREFEALQQKIMEEFGPAEITPTQIMLPTMPDAESRFDAFAQKIGHTVNTLEQLARLFYPELKKKWIDGLTELTAERYGADAPFARYMAEVGKTLLFMLDLRNLVEHPKPGKRARVFDFRQLSTGKLLVPSVEFEGSPYTLPNALHTVMALLTHGMLSMSELMFVQLCEVHARPFPGFDIRVVELPPIERGNSYVRFAYFGRRDGQLFRYS
jgi:hypothetical protein